MSYSQVNPEIAKKFHEMKLEFTDSPQPELLLAVPNPFSEVDYEISVSSPEVTSLCPLNVTQPDHADITIIYYPKEFIVELKSIKLYLTAYRNVEIFHEAIAGKVLSDIKSLILPKSIKVICNFTVRGGIKTIITANG